MEQFIETFHIDWKLMIAQVLNFGLVFLALYLLAIKPVKNLIANRTTEIEQGLEDAKKHAELLEKSEAEYMEIIAQAKNEAHHLWKQSKTEAESMRAQMIEQTQKDIDSMLEKGKKNLEAEKVRIFDEARKEIADLVILSTEKILNSKVDTHLNEKIIKELGNLK